MDMEKVMGVGKRYYDIIKKHQPVPDNETIKEIRFWEEPDYHDDYHYFIEIINDQDETIWSYKSLSGDFDIWYVAQYLSLVYSCPIVKIRE